MLPSLWTSTALHSGSLEVQLDVDGQPRPVLPHQPQHHQDVPDLQGELRFPDAI